MPQNLSSRVTGPRNHKPGRCWCGLVHGYKTSYPQQPRPLTSDFPLTSWFSRMFVGLVAEGRDDS